MSTAGDTVQVAVAIGEHNKRLELAKGCSLERIYTAIEVKFNFQSTGQQVSHLQMWDTELESYIDIESGDEVVDKAKIKAVVINCQQTGPESHSEEARKAIVPYCTQSMFIEPDQPTASGSSDDGCARGHAAPSKMLWVGRDKLWVFFINPDKLKDDGWECRQDILNVQNIMDWVGAWNSSRHPNIPKFGSTDDVDKADIRVEFIDGGGTRSEVGTNAKKRKDKATMFLSLKGIDHITQKFLVIHEFGHALGLLHEHQRSDFWKVAIELINVDKMRNDHRLKNVNFDNDWLQYNGDSSVSEYDPDSVMHYWFDIGWLKNKFKDLSQVGSLPSGAMAVLRGIHKRHLSNPEGPSEKDLNFLQKLYGPASSPAPTGLPQDRKRSTSPVEFAEYDHVKLSPDHLGTLTDAAHKAKDMWKDIGLGLDLTNPDLNSIHTYNLGNDQRCFSDMLSKWLQGGAKNKFLGPFLRVLKSETVGKHTLCEGVAKAILSYNASKRPKR